MASSLPMRQIHLDFHTGPWIPDVGKEFDPKKFAQIFKRAHINSVTLFAKCHHGHLYYKTRHPARHPGLAKGLDLLSKQIEALHAVGIRAPIYISVQCDEFAANTHPEWIALDPEGKRVGAGPLQPGWQIMDMSSPYQDYLYEQTEEIVKRFKPADGIFFDMCWDQPSTTLWAKAGMAREDLDPESEEDRMCYANGVAMRYMERFHKLVKKHAPKGLVFFNGRSHQRFDLERAFFTHDEIESLPSGGWGYTYFPRNVRFVRQLGVPYSSHTARFHKSWADFGGLKPEAALRYETCQMIAYGSACCVGDQLHPRGTLDQPAYDMIGNVYAHVEACEPWCVGAQAVADVAVMRLSDSSRPQDEAETGALRMLMQLKAQFDIVSPQTDLRPYKLLILPDSVEVTPKLAAKIDAFLAKGGRLLASGTSGLDASGKRVLKALPIVPSGPSPFAATYFRVVREIDHGIPKMNHVMYDRSIRVKPARGAKVLAHVVEPYYERGWRHFCSHFQTPADKRSPYAAVVGKGAVAYIAYPIFGAYARHGNIPFRLLVGNVMSWLLPDPVVKVEGPSTLEVSVMRQDRRLVIHLLNFVPERRTEKLDLIEDIYTVDGIELSIAAGKKVRSVTLAPSGRPLDYAVADGRVNVRVDGLRGHAIVVVE